MSRLLVRSTFRRRSLARPSRPCGARQGSDRRDHVADREQPPISGDDSEKIGGQSGDARLLKYCRKALSCSSAPNTGLRTRRWRSALSVNSASNRIKVILDGIDGLVLVPARKRRRVSPSHSGYKDLACHPGRSLHFIHKQKTPSRTATQPIGIQEGIPIARDVAGSAQEPPKSTGS